MQFNDPAAWREALIHLGVRQMTAVTWADAFARWVVPERFSKGESEIPDFVAQALYETALLEHLEENLNYSAQRLLEVWPSRFHGLSEALRFSFRPEDLANLVYGKRMGNNTPGDGWIYRGRGVPMITGKDNYSRVGAAVGLDLVNHPELLTTPDGALRCGLAWWEKNIPDSAIGDSDAITHRVQGGHEGAVRREQLAKQVRTLVSQKA